MEDYLKYLIIISLILIFDALWIGTNIKMYSDSVKAVQKSEMVIRKHYAFIAYALVIFTVFYISIPIVISNIKSSDNNLQKLYKCLIYGGATGFVIYGIYNTTSLSIYKDYEWKVALLDTMWGTFLNTIIPFIFLQL